MEAELGEEPGEWREEKVELLLSVGWGDGWALWGCLVVGGAWWCQGVPGGAWGCQGVPGGAGWRDRGGGDRQERGEVLLGV